MGEINHTERAHALLSASGASRWLNCPPSARLEDKVPEGETSAAAAEGTHAHEFADLGLKLYFELISQSQYDLEISILRADKLYTSEMEGYVAQYVERCIEQYNTLLKDGDPQVLVEEKIDLTSYVPESFGTGDFGLVGLKKLIVRDFKYGKGLMVFADGNPQMMLYGLGMLEENEMFNDIEEVVLEIDQPRLGHVDSWTISAEALKKWGDSVVKPKAKLAFDGKGLQKSGDHCKWCRVKGNCATIAAEMVKIARHEFKDPHLLTDENLMDVYGKIDRLTDWAGAVKRHLLTEAMRGKQWPGLKVVRGTSQRKWSDKDEVMSILKKSKLKQAEYTELKLLGVPALEKAVPNFQKKLGDYVVKPEGAPTLVPLTDKRATIILETAAEAFEDEDEDEDETDFL